MKVVRNCFKIEHWMGFGDYLRGCCCLWELCNQRGYELRLYICHPLVKEFLEYPDSNLNINPGHVRNIGFTTDHRELIQHIESPGNEINVFASVLFQGNPVHVLELSEGCRKHMQASLKMNSSLEEHFKLVTADLPEKFSVVHIRLGDPVGPKEIPSDRMNKIKSIMDSISKDQPIYIISDNPLIKDRIASQYGFRTLNTKVTHFGQGDGSSNRDAVRDTLVEFFLLSKSSQIYTLTVYDHTSGFTIWPARIYNIPIQYFRI